MILYYIISYYDILYYIIMFLILFHYVRFYCTILYIYTCYIYISYIIYTLQMTIFKGQWSYSWLVFFGSPQHQLDDLDVQVEALEWNLHRSWRAVNVESGLAELRKPPVGPVGSKKYWFLGPFFIKNCQDRWMSHKIEFKILYALTHGGCHFNSEFSSIHPEGNIKKMSLCFPTPFW
jgi:hypothetical protein